MGRGRLVLALLILALLIPQVSVAKGAAVPASGGALSAWGFNNGGQLGDGTFAQRDEPIHVTGTGPSGLSFVAIDGGLSFSVGLTANGTAYAWGDNGFAQLGNPPGSFSQTPQPVPGTGPGGIALIAIAAGNFFTLGLTADGTAYGWGDNREGQLGDGTMGGTSAALVKVSGTGPGGIVLTAIAAGHYHGMGLTANGSAYTWGWGDDGQLGIEVSGPDTNRTTPVQVDGSGPGGIVFTALAGGNIHSLGLTADGTTYAWGNDSFGQLGTGTGNQTAASKLPGTGPGGIVFTAIDAGVYHSMGLAADGSAYAWGRNQERQLGNGIPGNAALPQRVPASGPGGIILTAIAAGGYHSLGLTANGTAYAWGWNQTGQVGNGTSGVGNLQATPMAVSGTGPGGIVLTTIVGGGFHNLASASTAVGECAGFADMKADDPACPAVASLTQRGVILGYATAPPTFGPTDNVQRAQVAVFLVRALGWQNRPTGPKSFTDLAGLVAELRTASLIIANACPPVGSCVANGYGDGRFGPTDTVTHAQVITFIARAFGLDPVQAWVPQPGASQPHVGVPAVHDTDVRTFVAYAGAIPNAPTTAAGWNAPASRAWVAMALHQALTTQP